MGNLENRYGSDHRGEKGRGEIRGVYLHSQLKHHPPSPGWADITIMIECMPESDHWQSICTPSFLWFRLGLPVIGQPTSHF